MWKISPYRVTATPKSRPIRPRFWRLVQLPPFFNPFGRVFEFAEVNCLHANPNPNPILSHKLIKSYCVRLGSLVGAAAGNPKKIGWAAAQLLLILVFWFWFLVFCFLDFGFWFWFGFEVRTGWAAAGHGHRPPTNLLPLTSHPNICRIFRSFAGIPTAYQPTVAYFACVFLESFWA